MKSKSNLLIGTVKVMIFVGKVSVCDISYEYENDIDKMISCYQMIRSTINKTLGKKRNRVIVSSSYVGTLSLTHSVE